MMIRRTNANPSSMEVVVGTATTTLRKSLVNLHVVISTDTSGAQNLAPTTGNHCVVQTATLTTTSVIFSKLLAAKTNPYT